MPAVLVLIVGSELIRTSVDRWFNAPMDEILSSANQIASDYYHERQMLVSDHATRIARALAAVDLTNADVRPIRDLLAPDVTLQRVQMVEVYRVGPSTGSLPGSSRSSMSRRRRCRRATAAPPPIGWRRRRSAGSAETRSIETLGAVRRSAARRGRHPIGGRPADRRRGGDRLSDRRSGGAIAPHDAGVRELQPAARPEAAADGRLPVVLPDGDAADSGRRDVDGPVSGEADHAARPDAGGRGAREIGAGRLDQRVEPQSNDEFGSLVEAFNSMAGELATSRRKVERSTIELERKHVEVEGRRRYIETILERITTGVVSVDAAGAITTINSAAARLLSLDRTIVGQPARASCSTARTCSRSARCWPGPAAPRREPAAQEIAIPREGQELHLAVVATALVGDSGAPEGVVLVLDDVTPLIRRRRWRRGARSRGGWRTKSRTR